MSSIADETMQDIRDSLPENCDEIYTRHVTELGEQRQVQASEDIFSATGHKLLARQARIDRGVFEKLTRHKLLRPLDHSLSIEGAVQSPELVTVGQELAEQDPLLQALHTTLKNPQAPLNHLGKVILVPPLAAKLTVFRERMSDHFRHAVRVALTACALAESGGAETAALSRTVCTAGLFHDLGELHISPEIFALRRPLEPPEERQVRAHPVIAYLLLREFPQYHPEVSRAVLEHHERLDGSGYPQGRSGDRLAMAGRILAVAELAVALCDRGGGDNLAAILKGQPEKLDALPVGRLLLALQHCPTSNKQSRPTMPEMIIADLREVLDLVQQGLEATRTDTGAAARLINGRLTDLARSLDRAGMRAAAPDQWLEDLQESPELSVELAALTREASYRLKGIAAEIQHQQVAVNGDTRSATPALSDWLDRISRL
ncbi:HD-GYP domain-containing protein [Thioalkalivibrio sulfidiphilus]|uniref:Metal dependent phosphohydrolase n=1 Tax=Thioalkalivibrio sulfidiphilus (strain HL-EbGR7) TaxID=396588 RepID=B8GUC1_THISH|nr:HD domain-containing phosphohydrolase [Thioalkalivibrio sulfidiphilus]ACL73241.1 metal dependent phosphohydrolase [Thioalkalivibrio sulfidiphilus HL-EbGr7]